MKCNFDPNGHDKGGKCGVCYWIGYESDCPCFSAVNRWQKIYRTIRNIATKQSKGEIDMENYKFGFNILKQFLFGIGYWHKSISICIGFISIEIHLGNMCNGSKWVSYYNELSTKD